MAGRLTVEHRSWNMSRIKGKDTSLEVQVRKYLWDKGYRYRKNYKSLPGKPDVVLTKYRIAIFVNGCFWHHHNCRLGYMPKSRVEFWQSKFEKNMANDAKHIDVLNSMGYKVFTVWECDMKASFEETMSKLVESIENVKNGIK